MPRFKYEGRDVNRPRSGIIIASNKQEAATLLKKRGIRVSSLEIQADTLLTKDISIGKPISRANFIMFLRQFSTLLRAGVTIVEAVRILVLQVDSKAFKNILTQVGEELRAGTALSEAFSHHPKAFEPICVHMLRAGEMSGTVDESLNRLADHYEKSYRTRQKVISALSYPIIVGIIAVAVVIFLLTFVVPMFVDLFESIDTELPALTKFVLAASHFSQDYWYVVVGGIGSIFLAFWLMKRNASGQYLIDTFLLRLPIFGEIVKKSALASLTRTLSSLYSSSVPILQSLAMTESVVTNKVIAKVLHDSRKSLEKGQSLTEPMVQHWAFPPLIPHMIAIGEETGSLDDMLIKVAQFYEQEVEAATERLKALIEPVMIVILAAVVGTIVLSIMLPMFAMFEGIDNF